MCPKDFKCFLPIEVKSREFDTKLYLALKLVENGFTVVIGKKNGINKRMLSQNKPFVYFDKGISPSSLDFYKAIKASNGLMVEIQEEGNINLNSKFLIKVHNSLSANLFSLIFSWSSRAKEIIDRNCKNLNDDSVIVSGHPSFDLLHESLIGYYYKLRNLRYKLDPGYILINTNFSKANGIISLAQSKLYNKKNIGYYDKISNEKIESGIKFEKKIFLKFIEMIKILSKSFQDKNFIVRPHPSEQSNIYEEEFENFNNVKVIKEGSSKEWIVGADVVIHHDCTTGIEAFIAKKNVVSFCPYHDEDFVIKLPQDLSVKFNKVESIINYIKKDNLIDKSTSIEKKYQRLLDLTNNIGQGRKMSTDIIISSLKKLCNDFDIVKPMIFKRNYYLFKIKFQSLLNKIFSKKKLSSSIQNFKFPYLKKEELEERLNIWYELLSIEKITVKELEKDTFLLKK